MDTRPKMFEGEIRMFKKLVIASSLVLILSFLTFAQDSNEAFFAAARKGDVAAVKAFLDKGIDVNAKTHYGATALAYACDKGHTELVKLLLERGADPNVRDTFYNATPMSWAAPKGYTEIVKSLIEKGAKEKGDALDVGVEKGSVELVKLVLDKGDVPASTLTKALSKAEAAKQAEIVDLLKKAGAKPFENLGEDLLKTYTGFYKNEQLGDFIFAVKDGKLTGKFNTQNWFTLGAVTRNTFTSIEFDGVTLVFNAEAEKVISVTLKQGGGTWDFKRIEQK
jgi:ankyrin repeat protein